MDGTDRSSVALKFVSNQKNLMDALLNDLRFSLRVLARNPVFTAFTVITLGIGLGLNTALFTVINGVLLRPLPFARPAELVDVRSGAESVTFPVSWPNFNDWKTQSRSFAALAAYVITGVNMTGAGTAERVSAVAASSEFFDVLGVRAVRGRTWDAGNDNDNGVVISDALWRGRFGAEPGIVGRTITVNDNQRAIIGVMPRGFVFADAEVWVRMAASPQARRGNFNMRALGRLAEGTSSARAQQELDVIGKRLEQQYPQNGVGARLQPLQQSMVGEVRKPLFILLAAVGFVLLIACVNLASLTLARDDRRRRELAVRTSLGASRPRLIRQLLTEAAVTSLLACVVGVLLAAWGKDLLLSRIPDALPRATEIHIDGRVLVFSLAITCLTAALFGLGPALRAASAQPGAAMAEGSRSSTVGAHRQRARRVLVVAELAMALVPLAGAGLLLRSLNRLFAVDLGFQTEQVLSADYALPPSTYADEARRSAYADRLIASVKTLSGVQEVGVITPAPFSSDNEEASFEIEGRPLAAGQEPAWSGIRAVSPAYFSTAGIRLLLGRPLHDSDNAGSTRVALIDETFARRHFANENPIGKRVVMGFDREHPREIVGVVSAVRDATPSRGHEPHIYFPFPQQAQGSATLLVRASGKVRDLSAALQRSAQSVDANIPLYRVRTLEDAQRAILARSRFSATLFGLFAVCALLMAAAGVYGVMSYWVGARRREIGIRLALGARPGNIVRMIVGEGALMTGAGLVLGLAGALACARLLNSMLFETRAHDPLVLGAVTLLLGTVALCACYLPARSAARVDMLKVMSGE